MYPALERIEINNNKQENKIGKGNKNNEFWYFSKRAAAYIYTQS